MSIFTVTGKDLGAVVSNNIKSPKDLEPYLTETYRALLHEFDTGR